MTGEFLTFKTFYNKELAEDFATVLTQDNIPFLIEEDALVFDASFANHPLNRETYLKVRQRDFVKAHEAYNRYFAAQIDKANDNYYLFSFTDDELREIIAKPDEWGEFDYHLAQKILKDRGVGVSVEEKAVLSSQRYEDLRTEEDENVSNIVGYYILSLLIFPVGLMIGWLWSYSKKTLPNGRRIYVYKPSVRRHGKIILVISTALLAFSAEKLLSLISRGYL